MEAHERRAQAVQMYGSREAVMAPQHGEQHFDERSGS